jgi:hypothetical protein
MLHKTIISSLFLMLSFVAVQAEPYTTYVIANSLRLRNAPSVSATTVKLLPYYQKLSIIPTETPEKKDTIDNLAGYWIHVIANQDSGYVFSAYVYGFPPALPKSDIVMLDPGALNYSTYAYSPDYFWYRLGKLQESPHKQGLTPVEVNFFVHNDFELDATVSDSLNGYILGFKKEQKEGEITSNHELDNLIERMGYYPGVKLLPGQHIFLWSTMHNPGQEIPYQRNSFHLLVTGTVKNKPYLIAEDYRIQITHATEFPTETTSESYTVTTDFTMDEQHHITRELVSSCEQYLEIETPILRFAGDINRDGMPDLITSTNDDKNSYEMLIMSEITPEGVRYKIAAMIEYGPGC